MQTIHIKPLHMNRDMKITYDVEFKSPIPQLRKLWIKNMGFMRIANYMITKCHILHFLKYKILGYSTSWDKLLYVMCQLMLLNKAL